MVGKNKERLSCFATTLVIWKTFCQWSWALSYKLRCFRNMKTLSCDYTNNKIVWMAPHIFLGFLRKTESYLNHGSVSCSSAKSSNFQQHKFCVFFYELHKQYYMCIIQCVKVHYRNFKQWSSACIRNKTCNER